MLTLTQLRGLILAAEGYLISDYGNRFYVAGSTGTTCERNTLQSLHKRKLLTSHPEITGRGEYRITEMGRLELDKMRRMPKRPPQFTDLDERDLEHLAWRVYEEVASDLADAYRQQYPDSPRRARIHVMDFLDTMHSQLHSRRFLSVDVAMVARDAERLDRKTEAVELRGDRVPQDVVDAFLKHEDPSHSWASAVVERYMRKQATRGYLHP